MTSPANSTPFRSGDLPEIVPALIAYIDARGHYRHMSRACEEWYGIRREDHLNRHYIELLSPRMPEAYFRDAGLYLQRAFSGEAVQFESRILNSAGMREVRVSCTPDIAASGEVRGIAVLVTDITDLKRAEQESVISQERLQLAVEAGNLAFWEQDLLTGHLSWSLGCFHLLRHEGREAPSLSEFLKRVHPDDAGGRAAAFSAALAVCGPFSYEYRALAGDNSWRWIHSRGRFVAGPDGKPARALGVIFDVTDIKEAEERAARQARRIDQVLESTTDGVIMIDRQWRMSYFNPRAAAMLGLRTEHLGTDAWEIFPQARGNQFGECYTRAMLEGIQCSFEEYYPEPYNRWFEAHVYPTEEGVAGFFRDVTERRHAEEALRLQEQAIRSVPVGITIARLTPEGDDPIVYANPAFEAITGYERSEVLGRNCEFLHGPETDPAAREVLREAVQKGEAAKIVVRNYRKNGTIFSNEVHISPVRDEEGRITHLVGIQNDVSERILAAERLTRQAQYDALTGIPNRHLFLELLKQALKSATRRNRREMAVVFLDVDNLKHVNERLGHNGGDRFLKQVAHRITSAVRDSDVAARIGGDEFALLITDYRDRGDVEKLIERVLRKVAAPFRIGGRELVATVSAGYAIAPTDATDSEDLLRKADLAMYSAKRQCRNSWKAYCATMESGNRQILDVATGLRQALRRGEFALMYQPRIDAATGRLQSLEALIRWHHPERGLILPGDFIPVAEETGLIVEIGQWVIEEAVRQLAAWRAQGFEPVPISVNVSAVQFRNAAFPEILRGALEQAGVQAELLEIELTESIFMDESVSDDLLSALRRMGVRVAIDDFGTGYSGLGYLGRFSVDILKIDRSFTNRIGQNASYASICRSIVQLAQDLRLITVAEGVETADQAAMLREWGCDQLQGYHFGRPMAAAAIEGLLESATEPLFA